MVENQLSLIISRFRVFIVSEIHSKLSIFIFGFFFFNKDFGMLEQNFIIFCMKGTSAVVEGGKRPDHIL